MKIYEGSKLNKKILSKAGIQITLTSGSEKPFIKYPIFSYFFKFIINLNSKLKNILRTGISLKYLLY